MVQIWDGAVWQLVTAAEVTADTWARGAVDAVAVARVGDAPVVGAWSTAHAAAVPWVGELTWYGPPSGVAAVMAALRRPRRWVRVTERAGTVHDGWMGPVTAAAIDGAGGHAVMRYTATVTGEAA